MVILPDRRRLLIQAAALAGAALTPAAWRPAVAQTRIADYPFTLGVASGEPTPDGVVLWTRLVTRPTERGGGMAHDPVQVRWEVAEDEGFSRPVARGQALAVVEAAHSVHVEVAGLQPGRDYWYRFMAGGHQSPKGRTRTAPRPDADVAKLTFAFASCQKYESGFYAAHRDLAQHHPDLVLFLGDYIYEQAASLDGVRRHPKKEAHNLARYRLRYATYKADPDLQAAHAAAPWMTIWDDHEVENDYGGDQDRWNTPRKKFLRRRAAAYQAYYEHMPLRRRSIPVGPSMQLYRSLDWGRLAQFQFLDTRQYRPHRTCDNVSNGKLIPANCPQRFEPERSMLGDRQEAWLQDRFRATDARWNLLAQQYLMGQLKLDGGLVSNDCWEGFAANRQRIFEGWRDARVSNPVSLGGDIHSFFAGDLALEPEGRPLATEFVGGSISSLGRRNAVIARAIENNPNLKFGEGEHRGYGLVELTPGRCDVTFRAVDDARRADSPVADLARFVVEDGEPGLKRA